MFGWAALIRQKFSRTAPDVFSLIYSNLKLLDRSKRNAEVYHVITHNALISICHVRMDGSFYLLYWKARFSRRYHQIIILLANYSRLPIQLNLGNKDQISDWCMPLHYSFLPFVTFTVTKVTRGNTAHNEIDYCSIHILLKIWNENRFQRGFVFFFIFSE